MLLNPFEQLQFFVPQPTPAFGQVVQMLLEDRFGPNAIQPCRVLGCLAVQDQATVLTEDLSLYLPKYFLKDWKGFQRQEIRDAFQQVLEARNHPRPRRWVLCVPISAVTPRNRSWFDRWRTGQPLAVEMLDGNDLLKMLRESGGQRARTLLRAWGVTLPKKPQAFNVHGRLRVSAAAARSGLSHYLYVSLYCGGTHATQGLKVELAHSSTGQFSLRQDEGHWVDEGQGSLNPRRLRACRPLRPQEDRLVAVLPIDACTPLPLRLRLKIWSPGVGWLEQHLTVDQPALASARRLKFLAGPGPDPALSPPAFAA